MTARTPAQCGTNSGYQRHVRAGQPTCDACRAAHTAYRTERRNDNPEVRRRHVEQLRVVNLAVRDVLDAHPDEYRAAIDKRRREYLDRRAAELNGATS